MLGVRRAAFWWAVFSIITFFCSSYADVDLPVPTLSQNDPAWACDQLGTCTGWQIGVIPKICDKGAPGGCAITCLAMVCNYVQPGFTSPKELNEKLTRLGGYSGGCEVYWEKLNTIGVLPSTLRFVKRFSNKAEFSRTIDDELAKQRPVIARVSPQHFVVIRGKDAKGNYIINDPWDGKSKSLATTSYQLEVLYLWEISSPIVFSRSSATALVIDVSGSMAWQWKGGVKIESAKKAALQFLEQVANEPRQPGSTHMVCVVTFSSDAHVACPLTSDYALAKKTVISLGTVTSTNMGAGLDVALRELDKVPSTQRFIVLLSDGMTNTGKSREQILATAVAEARKKGICIHTVGFGDPGDIDEDFLKKIALQSGCGTYNYASSGFELFGTYIRVRHAMLGSNRIVDFTSGSTPVRMLPGQTATLGAFQLTAPAKELHFTLAWSEPGRMQAILVDPNNQRVTSNYPGVQIYSGNGFVHITVFSPKPGIWRASAAAVTSFVSGVQYYGVVSARTGGIVIPYSLPIPCFNVLGTEICVPIPDLPTVVIVVGSIAILAWVLYTRLTSP
ncbi:MAG: VWA domain-containing protein [Candidatus Hadarchaeum sp.]